MRARLKTRVVRSPREVVEHFDRLAPRYRDEHGPAERLLAYRLGIIRRLVSGARRGTLLEIGCGTAIHLLPLAGEFARAVGTDLSAEMIAAARRSAADSPWRDRVSLRVDPAEELATVGDHSVDVALCGGALEHMLNRERALRQVHRVLAPGGTFVCLTLNGGFCWYWHVAPRLGVDTRHLSTDRFLTGDELRSLAAGTGLVVHRLEPWRFIPKGDLPASWGAVLATLDRIGALLRLDSLHNGLAMAAMRPQNPPTPGVETREGP